jgi:hypothetical protein
MRVFVKGKIEKIATKIHKGTQRIIKSFCGGSRGVVFSKSAPPGQNQLAD